MGSVAPALLLAATHLLYFVFGWHWFRRQLFKDYEVRNALVRAVFAGTFALSCSLLQLLVFEVNSPCVFLSCLYFLSDDRFLRSRYSMVELEILPLLDGRFDSGGQYCEIVFFFWSENKQLNPFYSIFNYLVEREWKRMHALQAAILALCPILYGFWKIGQFFPILKETHSDQQHSLLGWVVSSPLLPDWNCVLDLLTIEQAVSRIGVVGVAVMAVLSGYNLVPILSLLLIPSLVSVPSIVHIPIRSLSILAFRYFYFQKSPCFFFFS
jgi:golgi pH regulator